MSGAAEKPGVSRAAAVGGESHQIQRGDMGAKRSIGLLSALESAEDQLQVFEGCVMSLRDRGHIDRPVAAVMLKRSRSIRRKLGQVGAMLRRPNGRRR